MLNEKEVVVLITGIAENDYNFGDCKKPIPFDSIEECCGIDNTNVLIQGLKRKGYVSYDNDYVWLTNQGVKFYYSQNEVAA